MCNYVANLTPKTDALEKFREVLKSDEKYLIFTTALILHTISIVLIATTAYMFVRHRSLRTPSHFVHLNLLVSDSVLLLTDWVMLLDSEVACDTYSLSFLLFGSSSIYTAVVIAFTRYEQMKNRSGHNSSLNKHPLLWILGIWIASILASIFPIYAKAQVFFMSSDRQLSSGQMCFFVNDIAYISYRQSITFLIVVILTPAIIMSFCYVRIYQFVRRARITRWLNQAAQFYSTHTTIIKSQQRRANIVPKKNSISQYPIQPNTISDREKHIIIKGLISVASQLLFWIPFGISWITSTSSGFRDDFILPQVYIMLLAKCSIITNISHYISFNVKFRKLYIRTIIKPLKKCCCKSTVSSIGIEISHISQIEQSLPRATCTSLNSARTIFSDSVRPSAHFAMRPIMEADVLEKGVKKPSNQQNTTRSVSSPCKFFHGRSSTVFPLRNSS